MNEKIYLLHTIEHFSLKIIVNNIFFRPTRSLEERPEGLAGDGKEAEKDIIYYYFHFKSKTPGFT